MKEIRVATYSIFKFLQREQYGDEIKSIVRTGKVSKSSSLIKLSHVYHDGLWKVGGRLQNSDICEDAKHPIILPSPYHVTKILIRNYHEQNAHMGSLHILAEILDCTRTSYGKVSFEQMFGL